MQSIDNNPYESPQSNCSADSSFDGEGWLFVFLFWPAFAIVVAAGKLFGRFSWYSAVEQVLAYFGILVSVCWIYFVVMCILLSPFIIYRYLQ